jgi:hypothetical protein
MFWGVWTIKAETLVASAALRPPDCIQLGAGFAQLARILVLRVHSPEARFVQVAKPATN